MAEALWLGVLFGIGAGLSVGPVFVTIVQETLHRGLGAGMRVILGSASADLVLVLPALAATWLIARVAAVAPVVGIVGAAYLLYLALGAAREARRLALGGDLPAAAGTGGFPFWKGVLGNLMSPLAWAFWLGTGTPTMLRTLQAAGLPGLAVFTAVWFGVAMAIEAAVSLAVARARRALGRRQLALLEGISALAFAAMALTVLGAGLGWSLA